MSASVVMPGPGHVGQWWKRPGEWVIAGEPVVSAVLDDGQQVLPAPAAGLLSARFADTGAPVAPGAELAYIDAAMPLAQGGSMLPWTPLRRRIAQHMTASSQTAAHVTTGVEVDLQRLESLRQGLRQHRVDLSLTPFFLRAAAEGVVHWPTLNGQVTSSGLWLPDRLNLGVTVAVPGGVLMVVLRDALYKSVTHLARELNQLAAQVRSGSFDPRICQEGTFCVTTAGSLGSVWGSTIIPQPNCAILICHAAVRRPVALADDRIAVRPVMNLALTFDHRVLDGVVVLGYLNQVKGLLERAEFWL